MDSMAPKQNVIWKGKPLGPQAKWEPSDAVSNGRKLNYRKSEGNLKDEGFAFVYFDQNIKKCRWQQDVVAFHLSGLTGWWPV